MYWWIPMAISAASSMMGAASERKQNETQQAWNQYNANMQYGTDMVNVTSQLALAKLNANLAMRESVTQQMAIKETSELNANIVAATTLYNDALYEEELSMMWDSVGLDLKQLENQRAVERGTIVANQGSSGTVIGEGSNADVVVHQKTQEAMDAFIVNHNADQKAAQISNARAQSMWQGDMQVKKIIYEGSVSQAVAKANGEAAAQGTMMSAQLGAIAGRYNAGQNLQAGIQGASMNYSSNNQSINTNLTTGMFGAASNGVQSYYKYKPVTSLTQAGSSQMVAD